MISFEPTEEEAELQRVTHRFAEDQIRPLARPCEEEGDVPDQLARTFWDLGLAHMGLPERCGGSEVGLRTAVLVEEELAWGDPGVCAALPRPGLAGAAVAALGVEAQRRWLEPFMKGPGRMMSAAVFEGASVSERPVATTTTLTGGEATLRGRKHDAIGADRAEWLLVAARSSGELVLVAVPRGTAAVEFSLDRGRLGLRAVSYGTIELCDCRVSIDHVLARGAPAVTALSNGLRRELALWTARAVGTARAAFDYAVRYAGERRTFGKPIAEHQAVAFMIADMGILVDAARSLLWHAAWAVDTGEAEAETNLVSACIFASDSAVHVATDAVQVLGGHGYVQDHPVEKWMRDARAIANLGRQTADLFVALGASA